MPKWFIHKAMGLIPLAVHILTQREKMTAQLWYQVMWDDDWTCQCCHIRNYLNKDPGKPKIEADHKLALFNWGYTVRDNMQALCKPCNRWKGVKILEDRVMYPAIKQMN